MSAFFTLDPAAVADCEAHDRQGVLRALATRFAEAYGLDAENVLEGLQEREKLGSTGFGRGVALPHARLDAVRRPVCALLRLATPVDFASADAMPVDLVFGLLSPSGSGVTHLHALAAISRLTRDDAFRDRLSEAPDCEAAFAMFVSETTRDAA